MLQEIIALALIIERFTEWVVGTPFNKIPKLTPYKWTLMYVAGALGLVAALTFHIDLLTTIGLPSSLYGEILTGIALGGGSNLIHKLFG